MGRGKAARKAKVDTRGPMQRMYDTARTASEQSELDVITPEMKAKGTYEGTRMVVNRGGTAVMRWIAAGKLSDTQAIAIQLCYRLWALAGINRSVTAAYGERVPSSDVETDERAITIIEARKDLRRIQNYIPSAYWSVFEQVCRFDEPAGVAGSRLGFGERSGQDRAHTIVCFVSDIIAMHERLVPVTRIVSAHT